MVIVNQDKEEIVNFNKVDSIWICPDEEGRFTIEATADTNSTLGYYETKTRAKEVLKEIWRFYEIAKRHECSGNDGRTIYLEDRFVYQMPEE